MRFNLLVLTTYFISTLLTVNSLAEVASAKYFPNSRLSTLTLNVGTLPVQERLDRLEKEINDLKGKPKPKDAWDKVSAVSGLVSGGLVAIIGIFATYVYNERQRKSLDNQKQREIAILQAQTIQSFMPQLQSDNPEAVEAALLSISAIGDSELATKLAALFKSKGAIAALEKIAVSQDQESAELAQKSLSNLFEPLRSLVAEIHEEAGRPIGAGFLVSSDGKLLTSYHVVKGLEDRKSIPVKIRNILYEAELIATKPQNDLALIRVKDGTFSYLQLAENPNMSKNENIFILRPTNSDRWIGAIGKILGVTKFNDMDVIETTAKTGYCISGSPAVNQYGEVVGMSFATRAKAFGSANLLVPVSYLIQFVQDSSEKEEK